MPVLSRNPRDIHDATKEAVVDSLLNNLSARLAGRGDFHKVIYGSKPSKVLVSEFILPMPDDERDGDEESNPICISTHGVDFQISRESKSDKMKVVPSGSVYLRVLPTAEEMVPGSLLYPNFPLTTEARREVRRRSKERLDELACSLPKGRKDKDWSARSEEVRRQVHAEMGLPFNNILDRTQVDLEEEIPDEEVVSEGNDFEEAADTPPQLSVSANQSIPDSLAKEIPPPQKWIRLDLTLPSFEFTPETALADSEEATRVLNQTIRDQIEKWTNDSQSEFGGKLWGYRRGMPIRPSNLNNWNGYLERVHSSNLRIAVPHINLRWVAEVLPDPVDDSQKTVHIALENWTDTLSRSNYKEIEPGLFQVSMSVTFPSKIHRFLYLDRIKPSYRYNKYLKYPALGFNGGVTLSQQEDQSILQTNWSPRYVLPRIVPTETGVLQNIEALSKSDCVDGLEPLVEAYDEWLKQVENYPVDQGLEGPDVEHLKEQEKSKLQDDLNCWKAELGAIRCGLEILKESRKHWSGPGAQDSPLGIPFEAWISMNEAMATVAKAKGYDEWRLFQLAFILASIPAFATRLPEFYRFYTHETKEHAEAVTLLYFATGGGKSEAFLGLLVFVLFLDRLRGKHRGVSALMRYPLRLLTLQQARRTLATMAAAEEVRYNRKHPGDMFSLGFWVGSSNTPNWHRDEGFSEVPLVADVPPSEEISYKEIAPYKNARERWLKLTACPFCGSKGGNLLSLRRHGGRGGNLMGHFCSAPKEDCSWNKRFDSPTPLPFYIVDEDIYDLPPSVLLGTVDKLSALGQSQGTIRKFFGLFGFAPLREKETGRLDIPFKRERWQGHPGESTDALWPSFRNGDKYFLDPFPSLLIQDEAHLLDESLGTFSGLFESALEAGFDALSPLLEGTLSYEPGTKKRRKLKVIAASATVSEPHRQMRNLYQREHTVQFPHPGPDLYESFYAAPKMPDDAPEDVERVALKDEDRIEIRAHWARVYCSILTNGHRHTVAMAAVLAQFHLALTTLYELLRSGEPSEQEKARQQLVQWVSPGVLEGQHSRLLESANPEELLTLVDLHRIALTYVTNKKGGDQVIDTEHVQFEKVHKADGFSDQVLASKLISGGISAAEIQEIVRKAESRVGVNEPFPDLNETLRSIIATSAISHGVDVEEFNAMFFAGIPSDIAEYIQASSRVGRTHVGFSLLIPVPQRYRDRFVLEVHDIFHRFLERMILPAAVDRWAEKALVRVMPSFFQEYLCGVNAIHSLAAAPDENKASSPAYMWATDARDFLNNPDNFRRVEKFIQKALGLDFSPTPEGYEAYKALLKRQITLYQQKMGVDRFVNSTRLTKFFETQNSLLRPMTSLRDVDPPGIIYEARQDATGRKVNEGATANVMMFIRKGSGADVDSTNRETESRD